VKLTKFQYFNVNCKCGEFKMWVASTILPFGKMVFKSSYI